MDNNFYELINELYRVNYKVKNMKLQKIIEYLDSNYSDDLLFGITDVAIYCMNQGKLEQARRLIEIINNKQKLDLRTMIKSYKKYSNNDVFKIYRTTQKYLADHVFRIMKRLKLNSLKWLCILSFNKNGYIRYNALMELNHYDYNETLPFYLYRVNDWVDVISNYSTQIVLDQLNNQNAHGYFSVIPLWKQFKLFRRQQNNINKVMNSIEQFIQSCDVFKIIYALEREKNIRSRRILIDYLVKREDMVVINFLKKYQDYDNYIALRMNAYLEKRLLKNDFMTYLKNSVHPYQAYIYINSIQDADQIMPYIYHPSLSVQRHARYIIRSYGRVITTSDYTNEISQRNYKRRHVIRGLIDICGKPELDLLKKYLNSKYLYARKYAFEKLCILQLIDLNDIKETLDSEISSYARRTLIKYKYPLTLNELINLYTNNIKPIRVNIAYVIESLSKWDALEGLLLILKDESNSTCQEVIYGLLHRWEKQYKKNRLKATSDQKTRIGELINQLNDRNINHLYYILL